MTIYGAGATESDADSSHADNPLSTLQHWYAVIRGLRVGVCLGWYLNPFTSKSEPMLI